MTFGRKALLAAVLIFAWFTPSSGWCDFHSPKIVGGERGRTYHVLCLDSGTPYIFRNKDGELKGIYVDILSSLGKKEDLKFSISMGDRNDARRSIHLSKSDIVAGTIFPTPTDSDLFGYLPARNIDPEDPGLLDELELLSHRFSGKELLSYVFSMPFFQEPGTAFFKGAETGDLNTLRGENVITVRDSPEERYLHSTALNVRILREQTVESALFALLGNRGEAAFLGAYQGIIASRTIGAEKSVTPARPFLFTISKGISVLKGQSALAVQLAGALSEMKRSGEMSRIWNKWTKEYEPSVFSPGQFWRAAGAAALLLLSILAWNIILKRKVRRMVKEREKILDFTREGILAVDRDGKITMINMSAQKLLGIGPETVGMEAELCVPGLSAKMVLSGGRPVYNHQQNLNGALVSCNKAPVLQGNKTVGAIITLRDMSELQAMAEEITGVKTYVESLRVQGHEFMNKLQAILGLIQLQKYNRAIEFISSETDSTLSAQAFMAERIKNAAICGILMGKAGRCRELGIRFVLDPESFCRDHGERINDRSLVIIVGNLLQNAIEAICEQGVTESSRIDFSIFDESGKILINVCDNAGTLTDETASNLFRKGFTTRKKAELSGFGLYNIKTIVDALEGTIWAEFETGSFTEFTVSLPVCTKKPAVMEVF
ncbi:MAG: transporter substrate-binding domain-containing protein [Synergistaceae bacterium]|nr:transporter substrate-binding domain-containing protein [Synergistaceae bacterium]